MKQALCERCVQGTEIKLFVSVISQKSQRTQTIVNRERGRERKRERERERERERGINIRD